MTQFCIVKTFYSSSLAYADSAILYVREENSIISSKTHPG